MCEPWSLISRKRQGLRVFENMVTRKIFGPKRGEVTEEWRRVHHEKLYDLYSTPDIIWMIKLKIMRWAGPMARVAKRRMYTGFLWLNLREMNYLKGVGVERRIIFKWLFKKYSGDVDGSGSG
jgi:hypothetical protein